MTTMNRLSVSALLLAITLLSAGTAQAQRGMTPEQMQERMTAQIEETIVALALEGDKAETVRLLLTAQGEKRAELQGSMFGGRGQGRAGQGGQGDQRQGQAGEGQSQEDRRAARMRMREQMEALDQETLTMLKDVLTEEEMVKYAEFVASRRPGGRRGGNAQIQ